MKINFTQEALWEALMTQKHTMGPEDVSVFFVREDNKFLVWHPNSGVEAGFDTFESAVRHAVRVILSHDPRYPA